MNKINTFKPIYLVILDGEYIGVTNDEDESWEIAQDHTNGTSKPLFDDDVDRVWTEKIDVNRWRQCEDAIKCVENKVTGETFMCYNKENAQRCIEILNRLSIFQEREEAKIRAMAL